MPQIKDLFCYITCGKDEDEGIVKFSAEDVTQDERAVPTQDVIDIMQSYADRIGEDIKLCRFTYAEELARIKPRIPMTMIPVAQMRADVKVSKEGGDDLQPMCLATILLGRNDGDKAKAYGMGVKVTSACVVMNEMALAESYAAATRWMMGHDWHPHK